MRKLMALGLSLARKPPIPVALVVIDHEIQLGPIRTSRHEERVGGGT